MTFHYLDEGERGDSNILHIKSELERDLGSEYMLNFTRWFIATPAGKACREPHKDIFDLDKQQQSMACDRLKGMYAEID